MWEDFLEAVSAAMSWCIQDGGINRMVFSTVPLQSAGRVGQSGQQNW